MNDKPKLGDRLAGGFARGLAIGWIVGAVWWVCLAIYFGPSGETFIHDGITEEKHISVLQRCIYAPIAGAPWAVVGGGVGAVIGGMGGWLENRNVRPGDAGRILFSTFPRPHRRLVGDYDANQCLRGNGPRPGGGSGREAGGEDRLLSVHSSLTLTKRCPNRSASSDGRSGIHPATLGYIPRPKSRHPPSLTAKSEPTGKIFSDSPRGLPLCHGHRLVRQRLFDPSREDGIA